MRPCETDLVPGTRLRLFGDPSRLRLFFTRAECRGLSVRQLPGSPEDIDLTGCVSHRYGCDSFTRRPYDATVAARPRWCRPTPQQGSCQPKPFGGTPDGLGSPRRLSEPVQLSLRRMRRMSQSRLCTPPACATLRTPDPRSPPKHDADIALQGAIEPIALSKNNATTTFDQPHCL
jgi:hypothetical protein